MACTHHRVWFIVIVSLHFVLAVRAAIGPAGELLPTPSDCCTQTVAIKTQLDMLTKVLNSVLTKMQKSTAENIAARHATDSQLLQLKTALETKTGNMEKETEKALNSIQQLTTARHSTDSQLLQLKTTLESQLLQLKTALETKTKNLEKGMTGLASLSSRVHVVESQQQLIGNVMTKQASIEAQQNLMAAQSKGQASEVNDLKKQVADLLANQNKLQQRLAKQEAASKQAENNLVSVTNTQVDIVQQVAEQTSVNKNQTREQDAFRITQAELRDKQSLLLNTVANHTPLIDACSAKLVKYKASCQDNICNTTATLRHQINTFSREQQDQDLEVKRQASLINKISEQRVVQDNKTSAQLKYLSGSYKQLNRELSNVKVAHNRLEQDFDNYTRQARRIDDLLTSQQQVLQMQQEKLETELKDLEQHLNLTYKTLVNNTSAVLEKDCADLYKNGVKQSGVYTIHPKDGLGKMEVYCDMVTDGGGWTVIQRRQDGSVDFYRDWADYRSGFGDLRTEFWLGNEEIHRLTHQVVYKLRVDLEDFNNSKAFAVYDSFSVGSEKMKYNLTIGSYSGTAGDSLTYHNGQCFSTKDRDNDLWFGSCATERKGAWWYYICNHSNLNGLYGSNTGQGVNWGAFKGYEYSLKRTSMVIRPVGFKSSK